MPGSIHIDLWKRWEGRRH